MELRKIIATTIREYLNENKITKTVYRGGSEIGSNHFNATFYTDSELVAKDYAKQLHGNNKIYKKNISFNNPLVLIKSQIGEGKLYEILVDIFGELYVPNVYNFPFELNDKQRISIIEYAKNNGYDGIIMDDTDFNKQGIIRSYITF
ncbi:MAG: hypothetical protein BWX59_01976 [Bacteroidetes bacterium ADurb.Bin028]|jgi:hypothetical protein|nr:MAG: hypothetical protein BWX59_01976 [Bacteroidetes bacterium ADurb.Bin028]